MSIYLVLCSAVQQPKTEICSSSKNMLDSHNTKPSGLHQIKKKIPVFSYCSSPFTSNYLVFTSISTISTVCFKPSCQCGSVDGNVAWPIDRPLRSTLQYLKFGAHLHGPQRMNLSDFGDPLPFHFAGKSKFQRAQYFGL